MTKAERSEKETPEMKQSLAHGDVSFAIFAFVLDQRHCLSTSDQMKPQLAEKPDAITPPRTHTRSWTAKIAECPFKLQSADQIFGIFSRMRGTGS